MIINLSWCSDYETNLVIKRCRIYACAIIMVYIYMGDMYLQVDFSAPVGYKPPNVHSTDGKSESDAKEEVEALPIDFRLL